MFIDDYRVESIKKFVMSASKLDELYNVKRDELDENWFEIKGNLAKAFEALYKFQLDIFSTHPYFKEHSDEIRFWSFYFDLIASKLNYSIFTETPKNSLLDISMHNSEEIANLCEYIYANDLSDNEFRAYFMSLNIKIFLMFDFIFYKKNGVFTRFEYNKTIFTKIKNMKIFEYNNNGFIRKWSRNLIKEVLKQILEDDENFEQDINDIKIYQEFVKYSKDKRVLLEPFSYILAYRLWKISRLISYKYETVKITERIRIKDNFKEEISNYVNDYLNLVAEFYDGNIENEIFYLKIFEIEKKFILNYVFKEIFNDYKTKDLTLKQLDNYNFKPTDFYKKEGIKKEKIEYDLKKVITKMIDNEAEKKFKFRRVLEEKKYINKTYLLLHILYKIVESQLNRKDTENKKYLNNIVGLYKSGSFIAHCLNIYNFIIAKKEVRHIYHFVSFPYLSFHPRSLFKGGNILFIDENRKTNFTLSTVELYRKRSVQTKKPYFEDGISKILTIAEFTNYKKVDFSDKKSKYDLCDIVLKNDRFVVENIKLDEYMLNEIDFEKFNITTVNWKEYFEYLSKNLSNILNYEELYKKCKVDDNRLLDVNRLLADSHMFFAISTFFAQKINELFVNIDKVALYSVNDTGSLMSNGIAFAYHSLFNDKNFLLERENIIQSKDIPTIFVDLTVDTFYTLNNSLKIDRKTDGFIEKIFVIFANMQEAQEVGLEEKICKIGRLHEDEN